MALTRLKTATLLAGLAGAFAAPGAAQAQFFFDTWGGRFDVPLDRRYDDGGPRAYREAAPLDRAEIRSILARRGYRVDPSIARNRDVYLVDATDPAGRRLRLIVDAYDATILRRLEAQPARRLSREEEDDRWLDGEGPVVPPRGIPGEIERQAEPHVIPGIGPERKPKPAPKKPAATARVEPRPAAPKHPAAPPAAPAPHEKAPAPTAPGPAAEAPKPPAAAPKPEANAAQAAEASTKSEAAKTEPAKTEASKTEVSKTESSPRVIPLYRKPEDSSAAPPEKPIDDAH